LRNSIMRAKSTTQPQLIHSYKKMIVNMNLSALTSEKYFIMNMDRFIKSAYGMISYKILLNDLAESIQKKQNVSLTSGNKDSIFLQRILEKSKSIQINLND